MVAMNQDYSQGLMIGLGVVFMIIPVAFVCFRVWAKFLGARRLGWEDYLCFAALAVALTCSILQVVAAVHGSLGQHQNVDEKGMPILDDPEFLVYERTKFAVNILSVVSLGLIKASILLFYKNIFSTRAFKWAVWVMMFLVVGWTVAYSFANLFTCYPVTPLIEPFYGNKCISGVIDMWLSVVYTDLIIDVGILIMPIPMVVRLQLPWQQKLGIMGMFLLGSSVIAISATRLVVLIKISEEFAVHFNDATYYTSPVFFWTNIELSLAVVSSCLPTLRPIWTHFRPSKPSTNLGNTDYELGNRRSKKFASEQWTEIDDADALVPGVDTSIQATDAPHHSGNEIAERTATPPGPRGGISVHTSVETKSVRNII
ncbi:unnamed protein product [Periconia digitata]|uniref:Rhodopsin domain-containing protein n=1 Tax=Periconia digitata TaxID=1303443 RepID=A0A9W4U5I7_9PLEO|nr:unnamed protein product [Periconia digitata]